MSQGRRREGEEVGGRSLMLTAVFRRGKSATSREKMINWLVSQHLTTHRHWLTNSVFVTEGEMLPTARPQLTTRLDSLKQYETEVATPELVQTLLSDLGNIHQQDIFTSVINNVRHRVLLRHLAGNDKKI